MKQKIKIYIIFPLFFYFSILKLFANPLIQNTQMHIKEWVLTEKLISEEQFDWEAERELLNDSIYLLENKIQIIDHSLDVAKEALANSRLQGDFLDKKSESLKKSFQLLKNELIQIETQLLKLFAVLPQSLQNQCFEEQRKLLRDPEVAHLPEIERLEIVLEMLKKIEAFNQNINVFFELHQMPDGQIVEVQVLYIGLGAAFFIDNKAQYAGWLHSTHQGWIPELNSSIASEIRNAIDAYERNNTSRFVELTVNLEG